MNNIAAVVVTYNRKQLLETCLEKLEASTYPCDILLIDNGSTDGTEELVKAMFPGVAYFNTGANLGGAGGFRVGMELAVQKGYEYAWIMDDDTFVNPDTLEKLMEADRSLAGNWGFLSSYAYWTDGSRCNMNFQRTGINTFAEDFDSLTSPVIMATFVSFLVKCSIVREVGLPIKEFFIWCDDLEYSRRVSMKYPCYFVPSSTVEHHMGSNAKVGIESESADRLWRYEYLYRNEYYVFTREGLRGRIYVILRVLLHSMRVIKSSPDKKVKLKVIWKSFNSGHKFHPDIEYVQEVNDEL